MTFMATEAPYGLHRISKRNGRRKGWAPPIAQPLAEPKPEIGLVPPTAPYSEPHNAERMVLIVDEARGVRSALAHALRGLNLEVLSSASAEGALSILEDDSVDIVIVDQALSGGRGIEFLERVRVQYPRVKRALLTGHRDFSTVREAINRAGVALFLSKPWEKRTLRQLVGNLLEEGAFHDGAHAESPSRQAASGANTVKGSAPEPGAALRKTELADFEAAGRIFQQINSCDGEVEIARALVREFQGLIPDGEFWWINVEDRTLTTWVGAARKEEQCELESLDPDAAEIVERVLRAPNARLITPASEDNRACRGFLALPVRLRGRTLAAFGVLSSRKDFLKRPPLTFSRVIAEPLACAVARSRQASRLAVNLDPCSAVFDSQVATLGNLAAGVAHEIRNPLAAMMNSISLLRSTAEDGSEECELLSIVLEESRRVNRMVGDFLTFARPDSGPGIPAERRERVFEPFETSKPNGTGLGLSLARHIAESHGGSIHVEDSALGGARLCVALPVVSDRGDER